MWKRPKNGGPRLLDQEMVSFYPLVFLFHQFSFTPFSVHPPNGGRTWTYGINIGCSFMNGRKAASSLSCSGTIKSVNMFMNTTIKMAFFRRRLVLLGRVQQTMQAIFRAKSVGQGGSRSSSFCFWFCAQWYFNLPLVKAMQKIGRNRTREIKSFVSFVKVYRRPYPHHRMSNSCSRTLIVWKQSLEPRSTDLETGKMARSGRFELPTPRFVV